jgi:DNA-binding SARP family transcriptional activator
VDREVQSGDRLRIRLFGGLAIEDGARVIGPKQLGGVRPKQVLEILLAARGHRVPTERLAEMLWGSEPPSNAAASIQTFVSVLRRALVPDRDTARRLIVTEASAYRFATELIEFDLDAFDRLLARSHDEPQWVARRTIENALCLARGDVLEDEPYSSWADELRRSYTVRTLDAHVDVARIALAELDFARALGHADAATAIDGFSDSALRTAMLALYAQGRQHDALARYRSFRTGLDAELGLQPSSEARALESAILREEDPQTLLPRPIAPAAERGGEQQPSLLGRTEQMRVLEGAIRSGLDGTFGLIQIEGEAGAGKTRLLDELAGGFSGVRIGRATCSILEQHLQYVPLAEAIRDAGATPHEACTHSLSLILPEFTPDDEPRGDDDLKALEALVELVAENAPIVLMLDDLQFADPSTVGALSYLQRRCAAVRGGIVVAVRTEHTPAYHPARGLQPDTVVQLPPLTPSDLAPLGIPGLYESTGGNARFVAAALANPNGPQPSQSLAETVLAQCWQEGPRAYRVLVAASLLEPPFEPHQLESMLGLEVTGIAERLETLCQRGILRADEIGFRFKYELVREVLLDDLSPARVRLLQQRLEPVRLSDYRTEIPT